MAFTFGPPANTSKNEDNFDFSQEFRKQFILTDDQNCNKIEEQPNWIKNIPKECKLRPTYYKVAYMLPMTLSEIEEAKKKKLGVDQSKHESTSSMEQVIKEIF